MTPLPLSFYQRSDVVMMAKELLGKKLFTRHAGILTGGIIVETEAYAGATDRACHTYNHKRTKRTEVMYGPGGFAYVYLCYGIHALFNVITNVEGIGEAVLIRALWPTDGIALMKQRRKQKKESALSQGPGTLSQALGITLDHYGIALNSNKLWIADAGIKVRPEQITATPRIGVDYAGEDAKLPYRFLLQMPLDHEIDESPF